jgi:hypothetical protein
MSSVATEISAIEERSLTKVVEHEDEIAGTEPTPKKKKTSS